MSTGTLTSNSSTDVVLGNKKHWLKFSEFIMAKAKSYGDVERVLQDRVTIDYFTRLLAEKERQQTAKFFAQKTATQSAPFSFAKEKTKETNSDGESITSKSTLHPMDLILN